ncbi:MAG TPA: glycosyltransferase family 4 protein [Pyrinomonadaceae bacterium]|jgi:UDP-N-acetylmuramyl pentapeptide phosphotransferase/UDP-N-acetylglucosamine-1-phosphate transferase
MTKIISYIAAFFLTYVGVEIFRRWSLKRNIFDIPNERSSHTEPTPRGGGLIIDVVCLSIFLIYCLVFQIDLYWSYFAGALILVLISWLDDLFSVPVVWRFLCHSLAAALVVWSLGFWETVYIPFYGAFYLGQIGLIITFFWIVWMINAYNFMDGIDGIAGTQALTAGIGWLIVGMLLGSEHTGFYGGVLAFSSLGFLIHNWSPAKIFMGDVGSAFLGYTFAVLPLLALKEGNAKEFLLPVIAVSAVLLFVFDSLFTLFKRLLKREKIWQAHREHIYQRLIIAGFSHKFVTALYGIFSIFFLLLLIFWIEKRGFYTDFVFLIIALHLICLLIYSYSKKTLT